MRPIIGVTSGTVVNKDYPNSPAVIGQQFTYIRAIERAGGTPIIIPIVNDESVLQKLYDLCQGVVFAGGNDIDPKFYNTEPSALLGETDPDRDKQELLLWEWSKRDDKAVLAICRGMQLINIGNGGTLYQDIPTELPHAITHRVEPDRSQPDDYHQLLHKLRLNPDSKLKKILGSPDMVHTNAFHHQAVKQLGSDLIDTAWTEDDVIEGIEMPKNKFVVGVQSHPESLEERIEPIWRNIFTAFVKAAAK